MKPFKHILVPVDFSVDASTAIQLAADLSQKYGAQLTLLHVRELVVPAAPNAPFYGTLACAEDQIQRDESLLESVKEEAIAAGATHIETLVAENGNPSSRIVSFATRRECDLIVLSTHGRSGVSHMLLGSIAENVIRTARCPVLTTRPADSEHSQSLIESL